MTKELKEQICDALNLHLRANEAMTNAIIAAVKKRETIDEDCGYTELRFIRFTENGNLCVFDDENHELYLVEDLSSDHLKNICVKMLVG